MSRTLDINMEHSIFSNSFTFLILFLLIVLTKSLSRMPDIITCWTDFETNFSATDSKPFMMLDALL